MKHFIIKTGTLFAILLVLNAGLDFGVSSILNKSKVPPYVGWNDIIHDSLDADLLIMGSSRALVQYNPAILDSILHLNSYNLGMDGRSLNSQIPKYNVYRKNQSKPKTIIVNIDYFSALNYKIGYDHHQFFPYIFNSDIQRILLEIEPFSWAELHVPIYRYTTYCGLYYLMHTTTGFFDQHYKGFEPKNILWDGSEYEKIKCYHCEIDGRTMSMFEDFLSQAQAEDIKVLFCYAPIYFGLTEKVDNLEEMYSVFSDYSQRYDIPILDYNFSVISRDTTYFYNASHLNKLGADLFTTQLAKDIDSLQLLEK